MGTVGSEFRMNTTVIGDPVNTAARLEKLTKKIQYPFLVSGDTLAGCNGHFKSTGVGNFQLRGKDKHISVHKIELEESVL